MIREIAYITDIHLDEEFPVTLGADPKANWKKILKDISLRGISEIVFGGDIGSKEAYKPFFNSLKDFKLSMVLGNHDLFSELNKYYKNPFFNHHPELYYSHEEEYFKYIYLDSSSDAISQNQFEWFLEELKTDKKIILFIHHPILPINTIADKEFPLSGRDKIKAELQKLNNEINVFCGHYHTSDTTIDKNIKQIATLAGSFQIRKNTEKIETINAIFGYRIIKLNKDKMDTELVLF